MQEPVVVCVDVPVTSPRQECRQVPRTVCDILESSVTEETCTAVPLPTTARQGCKYKVGWWWCRLCVAETVSRIA